MGGVVCRWFFLLISVNIVFDGVAGIELCDKPADIAFVIDSSSSIWIYDFEKQIKFVQELVKMFDIGPDTIRVSALTFSHNVVKEFNFNDVNSAQEANDRIGNIVHESGQSTFTHNALELMRTDLFLPSNGARADVAKICILLTDGESTYSKDTIEQARLAKAAGITIIAIGIGDKVGESELMAVVSPPAEKNYFHSSTFDNLKEKLFPELIGKTACDVIETSTMPPTTTEMQGDQPTEEACKGKNADILFVVDMSSSIWVKHFKEQLQFIAKLVGNFDINSGRTRVGMVTFSNATEVQFYLDKYSTQEDIKGAILAAQSRGGITNTHLALQAIDRRVRTQDAGAITHYRGTMTCYISVQRSSLPKVRYEMFSTIHGSRDGVAHICIVITDGVSRLQKMTIVESNLNHKAGIDVIAIGVGDEVDEKELNHIASRPEYVFEVNNYDALKNIENILAVKTCEATPAPAPPQPPKDEPTTEEDEPTTEVCRGKKEDVVFVVDMSNSIWVVDFKTQLEFLSDLVGSFDINGGNARVGLLTFSTDTKVQFNLNTYSAQDEVSKAILAVKSEGGLTNTHLALQRVRDEMMTGKHGSRSDVDHVIIVITDGISRVPHLTATQADKIHQAGIEVIAIGVGEKANEAELAEIASRPEFVFEVSGYDTLQKIRNILARTTCEVA